MPRINLLPWREQQRTERKKAFAVGMFGAFIGALAVAGVAWFLVGQMIDGQAQRNELLRNEIRDLDKKIEEINSLETQKQQFIARMRIIETLQRSRPEIVHVFDTFTRIMPDGMYLTSLQQTGRRFRIQGVTQSPGRVSALWQSIEESQWLTKPGLEKIEATGGNSRNSTFIMTAEQVAAQAAK